MTDTTARDRILARHREKYGDLSDVMSKIQRWHNTLNDWNRPYNRDMESPVTEADVDKAEAEMLSAIRAERVAAPAAIGEPVRQFDNAAFMAALEHAMKVRNVTARQVSEATGVSDTTLSRVRAGTRKPDAASFAALCAWAGMNPADFMQGLAAAAPSPLGDGALTDAAELAELREANRMTPDHQQLAKFYGVTTYAALVQKQAYHIEKLQAKLPTTPNVFAPQRVREG